MRHPVFSILIYLSWINIQFAMQRKFQMDTQNEPPIQCTHHETWDYAQLFSNDINFWLRQTFCNFWFRQKIVVKNELIIFEDLSLVSIFSKQEVEEYENILKKKVSTKSV